MAEHIVVGIDGSSGAREALDWALRHCHPDDTVEVVHTWNRPATNPAAPAPIDPMILERGADAVLQREMDELENDTPSCRHSAPAPSVVILVRSCYEPRNTPTCW